MTSQLWKLCRYATTSAGARHSRRLHPCGPGLGARPGARTLHARYFTRRRFPTACAQVLNVAYCQLASFEPQTPAPPPPDAAALERLLRAARKEAASRAKAEERRARAAASRASKRRASPDYNSEEEEQEEDESAEPRAITEEGVLLEMLAAHQAGVQEANEEAAGPEDAALLSQFAAPALVHLIANCT